MTFKIHLIPDTFHLHEVGRLESGACYWIDVQLNPENNTTRDFLASYVFDDDGRLIWHQIDDLGLHSDPARKSPKETLKDHKAKIGQGTKADIWVSPFSVEAFGLTFGLVVREPESGDELDDVGPLVDAMPGWTLMFFPPWDEGMYDT